MITEDIDISWRLQLTQWEIRFEPGALCWILMPESLKGLWRQRLRWAQGGCEVLGRYFTSMFHWKRRRMWLVFLEYFISIIWSYTLAILFSLWLIGKFIPLPTQLSSVSILPDWAGLALSATCLLQFGVSLKIDSRYEKGISRYYYWIIWYPIAYWLINMTTMLVGLPKALFKKRGTRAKWISPDRGFR